MYSQQPVYFKNDFGTKQGRIQGRDLGGPPLFLDQIEAWRAPKNFFGAWAPTYLRV